MDRAQIMEQFDTLHMQRRQFVKGLAAGTALLGLGGLPTRLFAEDSLPGNTRMPLLQGSKFNLAMAPQQVNFTGKVRTATAVNGSVPGPILRWKEGDTVSLKVTNHLAESSSIHWHGIILPNKMDGVPGITFPGIEPGESYHYTFGVRQSGTYWYHSHSGFQEQTGLYGAIIIDPIEPEPFSFDRDYVVMLSDWSDEDPNDLYAHLKKMAGYYNFAERTSADVIRDIQKKGLAKSWNDRSMWNTMRMSQRDISDVTGYTYTYLMNGQTPATGWTGLFKGGEKVRLRFINGSAMSFFDVRIPELKMTVVAADGQNIEPVTVDEFRIGVAETYDVIVEPQGDRAYAVFAQAIDRTGYAMGTLTPDVALRAEVPEYDPYPLLTMTDMGMDMGSMAGMSGMGSMNDMSGMEDTKNNNGAMQGMHKMDGMQKMQGKHDMKNMKNMGNMQNMPAMEGMNHAGMSMAGMKMQPAKPMQMRGPAGMGSDAPVVHAPTEFGPHVDMRTMSPQYRLDDPGVGLRDNGRRVLTYADLRNLYPTPDTRDPGREIQLHLTGNMARYMWSINGIKYADAEPIKLSYGERVRITFVNDTMMNHPMHLHGMWSDLETGDGKRIPRKHTVIVQPGAKISYLVTADALGGWAYHCHLLYHMLAMFRKVVVSK